MIKRGPVGCALVLMLAAGCAKTYAPPAEGAPAATVKVVLSYDHAKAIAAFPSESSERRISVEVSLNEDGRTYRLLQRAVTENLDRPDAPPLEVMPLRVHPGRAAAFTVRLGAVWKATTMEYVMKEERKPKQVTKQERVYNASTKTYEYQTRTVTEYELEKKQVLENVTREHFSGCSATAAFRPEKDRIYRLDYANQLLTEGCTLKAFLHAPGPDGTMQLISP